MLHVLSNNKEGTPRHNMMVRRTQRSPYLIHLTDEIREVLVGWRLDVDATNNSIEKCKTIGWVTLDTILKGAEEYSFDRHQIYLDHGDSQVHPHY